MSSKYDDICKAVEERDLRKLENLLRTKNRWLKGEKSKLMDFVMTKEDFGTLEIFAKNSFFLVALLKCIQNNNFLHFEQLCNPKTGVVKKKQMNWCKERKGCWKQDTCILKSAQRSEDDIFICVLYDTTHKKGRKGIAYECIRKGKIDAVRTFLENGFNPDITFTYDAPLHVATENKHLNIVKLLIRYNADVNIRDCQDYTPLHYAVKSRDIDICKILLNNGANVNSQNVVLDTPLHEIYYCKNLELIKLLLNAGCYLNVPNRDGFTAITSANKPDILIFLIQNGSDANDPFWREPGDRYILKDPYFSKKNLYSSLIVGLRAGLIVDGRIWDEEEKKNSKITEIRKEHEEDKRKLKYLCRLTIRNHLIEVGEGRAIFPRVERLPIPSLMKSYLKLEY